MKGYSACRKASRLISRKEEVHSMPTYEAVFACRPDLSSEKVAELTEGVRKFILQNKGEILISENWGKKRLSYEVKGFWEGDFSRIVFSLAPGLIRDLEQNFRLNSAVIRHMVVRVPEKKKKPEKKAKTPGIRPRMPFRKRPPILQRTRREDIVVKRPEDSAEKES